MSETNYYWVFWGSKCHSSPSLQAGPVLSMLRILCVQSLPEGGSEVASVMHTANQWTRSKEQIKAEEFAQRITGIGGSQDHRWHCTQFPRFSSWGHSGSRQALRKFIQLYLKMSGWNSWSCSLGLILCVRVVFLFSLVLFCHCTLFAFHGWLFKFSFIFFKNVKEFQKSHHALKR